MTRSQAAQPGWWGQRWLAYVVDEVLGWPPEAAKLRRSRSAPTRVTFHKGRIVAQVGVGAYGNFFTATLRVKPLTEREWRRVLDALSRLPDAAYALIGGTPGPELAAAMDDVDVDLFPPPSGNRGLACTCKETQLCRHRCALMVNTADLLDGNPFLWLAVLGRDRSDLLAALRARLADTGQAAAGARSGALTGAIPGASPGASPGALPGAPPGALPGAAPVNVAHFWTTPADPATIPVRPGATTAPDALLRWLGPLPETVGSLGVRVPTTIGRDENAWLYWERKETPVYDVLRTYAQVLGQGATALASGERDPDYREEPPTGKALPWRERLVAEVEEAVQQTSALLSVVDLQPLCPTAAVLPAAAGQRALTETFDLLPPEMVALAGRYVGWRAAALTGAAFHHVVTFAEWRSGRLQADADWHQALAGTGHLPPYTVIVGPDSSAAAAGEHMCLVLAPADGGPAPPDRLFALLRPEVGDELVLTVADPETPLLRAALRRRADRDLDARQAVSEAAVSVLLDHMQAVGTLQLPGAAAVATLLARGLYRPGQALDPIWLLELGAKGRGLYVTGPDRGLSRQGWRSWEPTMRTVYGPHWPRRESVLQSFAVALANQAESLRRVNAAHACIRMWCQVWSGAQDRPEGVPPLPVLQNFLWNVAPVEARRHKVDPAWVPELMALWFTHLGETHPDLRSAYRDHVLACGLTEAYHHRQTTLARGRYDRDHLAWRIEAYRWMGPEGFFWTWSPGYSF